MECDGCGNSVRVVGTNRRRSHLAGTEVGGERSAGVTEDPGTQTTNSPRLTTLWDISIQWITPCACTVARRGEKRVQNP